MQNYDKHFYLNKTVRMNNYKLISNNLNSNRYKIKIPKDAIVARFFLFLETIVIKRTDNVLYRMTQNNNPPRPTHLHFQITHSCQTHF